MQRYTFCEVFAKKLLTPLKLYLACKLIREYGFTQLEVSKLLGIKQPLVNYVLSGRRKPKYLNLVMSSSALREYLDSVAESIARGVKAYDASITCSLCAVIRSEKSLLREIIESLGYTCDDVYIPHAT